MTKRRAETVARVVGDVVWWISVLTMLWAVLSSSQGCASAPPVPCSARDVAVGVCRAACAAIQSAPCAEESRRDDGESKAKAEASGEAREAVHGDVLRWKHRNGGREAAARASEVGRCAAVRQAQEQGIRGGCVNLRAGWVAVEVPPARRSGSRDDAVDNIYIVVASAEPTLDVGSLVVMGATAQAVSVQSGVIGVEGRPRSLLVARASDVAIVESPELPRG